MNNANEYQGYRPLNNQILVHFKPYKGKVLLDFNAEKEAMKHLFIEVLAVAPGIEDIEPGDGVYFPGNLSNAVPLMHPDQEKESLTNNGDKKLEQRIFSIPYHVIMGVKKGIFKSVKERLKQNA